MEIIFDSIFGEEYAYLEEEYGRITKEAFEMLNIQNNYEIDVSLVDVETIHEINRDYRGIDKQTDVISFALLDDGLDNVYRVLWLKKHNYDGIIHIKPTGCTPEVGALPIISNG